MEQFLGIVFRLQVIYAAETGLTEAEQGK